jgi:peroxiredoxin Q/BCP
VLGASFDSPEENKAFADTQNFKFALLSDVDRSVGDLYRVTREPGEQYADFAQRVAYLIDPDGVIRKAYAVSDVNSFAADVLADLEALRA